MFYTSFFFLFPPLVVAQPHLGSRAVVPSPTLLDVYPHDSTSYVEGLVYDSRAAMLFESAGQYTASQLRELTPLTGQPSAKTELPQDVFAEGIVIVGETLIQLTYAKQVAYIYNRTNIATQAPLSLPFETDTGQGWGLTANDTYLIASDGTDQLYFFNPSTLVQQSKMNVWYRDETTGAATPLLLMNELEYIGGDIVLANLFYPQYFLIWGISLLTGYAEPVANISTAALANGCPATDYDHVMNGIAVDNPQATVNQRLYLTGKYWTKVLVVSINKSNLLSQLHGANK